MYPTTQKQVEIFWNKVAITADDNQCWEWTASLNNKGYGTKGWDGKVKKAHQIAWMLPNYVIPKGMLICHSCDNPKCCNPKHLFLGTYQDNSRDMVEKGRHATGGFPAGTTLSDKEIIEAQRLYDCEGYTQNELADWFSVSLWVIRGAVADKSRTT